MEENNKKIHLGVYGVHQKDGAILVIRKARGPYTGLFDLPGGSINFGEKLEECLAREIQEETGAQLTQASLLGVNEYRCQYTKEDGTTKDFHHIGIYYSAEISIGQLKNSADGEDSLGAVFIPLDELNENTVAPIALPMIRKALAQKMEKPSL